MVDQVNQCLGMQGELVYWASCIRKELFAPTRETVYVTRITVHQPVSGKYWPNVGPTSKDWAPHSANVRCESRECVAVSMTSWQRPDDVIHIMDEHPPSSSSPDSSVSIVSSYSARIIVLSAGGNPQYSSRAGRHHRTQKATVSNPGDAVWCPYPSLVVLQCNCGQTSRA